MDYLNANPGAHDTVRGIVEWWLLKRRIQHGAAEVEAAVASLVAQGKLSAHPGPDGQIHYWLRTREPRGGAHENRTHGMVG